MLVWRSTSGGGIVRGVFMAKHSAALRTILGGREGGRRVKEIYHPWLKYSSCIKEYIWHTTTRVYLHSCEVCNIDGEFIANQVFKQGRYVPVHSAGSYVWHGIGPSLVDIVRCDKICRGKKCTARLGLEWERDIPHRAGRASTAWSSVNSVNTAPSGRNAY